MTYPLRLICRLIWNASEQLEFPLGRFAPLIFGGMMGSLPRKVKP